MKREFTCECCGGVFTPSYRLTQKRTLRFCSKSCAGRVKDGVFHRASDLQKAAIQAVKAKGRYMTASEIMQALGVSSKTFSRYNISSLACNREAGFKRPKRVFENLIGDILEAHFEVEKEVTFDDCLSPKGFPLRYDFRLLGTNVLIEADGNQHKPNSNWGSDYYRECDKIKTDYAKANDFILIRIPYTKRVTYDKVMSAVTAACKATT